MRREKALNKQNERKGKKRFKMEKKNERMEVRKIYIGQEDRQK